MSMIGFPLLLIPLAIVNIIVFLMPGVSFTDAVVSVPLTSKAIWKISFGDVLLALSMLLILLEVIKASRQGKYLTEHLLALLVFAAAVAEFLLLPQFATSVFFLLTVMTLVDFLAGISLRRRRARAASHPVSKTQAPSESAPTKQDDVSPVQPPPIATINPAPHASSSDETNR